MAGAGSGYDLSVSTFSNDGRLFQVEYASKATENSSTVIGICCKDGVVIAAERLLQSRMLDIGEDDYCHRSKKTADLCSLKYANSEDEAIANLMIGGSTSAITPDNRIYSVDKHIGIGICGLLPDGKALVTRARQEASQIRDVFNTPMTGENITARMSQYVHFFTCYPVTRPFGCTIVIASYGRQDSSKTSLDPSAINREGNYEGPALYVVDCSGTYAGFHACALGKAKTVAKTELEKRLFKLGTVAAVAITGDEGGGGMSEAPQITCREAIRIAGEVLREVHDGVKDRLWNIEIGWVSEENGATFKHVPKEVIVEVFGGKK